MHTRKTLITCAITGNITRPDQHPHLPITPEQIDAWRRGLTGLSNRSKNASATIYVVRDSDFK